MLHKVKNVCINKLPPPKMNYSIKQYAILRSLLQTADL